MHTKIRPWLKSLGLARYAERFEANDVDLRSVVHLTEDELKELGVSLGHRKILIAAIDHLKEIEKSGATQGSKPERRQLSVMFCDLVGSTELSRTLDPEELRDVLRQYHDAIAAMVQRYDGYVAKFLGDGVLVYFGWPQAFEDQAQRAVCAGLGIIGAVSDLSLAVPRKLEVRVGIETGDVVVGDLVGASTSDAEAVIGQTPNLAARIQDVAGPGQVVVGEKTRALLGGMFELDPLGAFPLKGFADEISVWQVLGEVDIETRFAAAHSNTLTERVGRGEELRLLIERWHQSAGGDGQVVFVSGEAGIGKSRLVQDLRTELGPEGGESIYLQCAPHRTNSAFHPVIRYLRNAIGWSFNDSSSTKLNKLEAFLARKGEEVEKAAPIFASMLSLSGLERYGEIKLSPQLVRNKTIDMFVEQIVRTSTNRPVLCVVEDAHWMDPSMRELIGALVDRVPGHKVCLVITFRPELTPPWWPQPHISSLVLGKLTPDETATIVRTLGGRELAGPLIDQIVDRSGGVPLYVEELTKSVLESLPRKKGGAADHAIPESLQSSLIARLDRLGGAKEIAQIGAVIGREFSHDMLLAMLNDVQRSHIAEDIHRLVDSGLVDRRGKGTEAVYTFKHALIQDAAYSIILRSRRKRLHAKILNLLETQFADHMIERADTLAHHAYCAESWEKAVSYLWAAGVRSLQRSALPEAAGQFEDALDAFTHLDDTTENKERAIDVRFELRNALWALGRFEDILTHLGQAEGIAAELDDPVRTGWILVFKSASHWQLGQTDAAKEAAEAALKISTRSGSLDLEVAANFYRGCVTVTTGACRAAEGYFEAVSRRLRGPLRAERCGLPFAPAVISRSWLVWALAERGDFEQGLIIANEALDLANELGNPFNLAHIYYDLGYYYEIKGDIDQAVAALEKAYGLVQEWGLTYLSPFIMGFLGHSLALAGRTEEGIDLLQRAQSAYETMGLGLFRSLVGIQHGEALLLAGEVEEARMVTSQAIDLAVQRGEQGHEAYGHRVLGDITAASGATGIQDAADHYERAMTMATKMEMLPLIAQCRSSLANLYAGSNRADDGDKHLQVAENLSREIGLTLRRPTLH